MVSDTLKKILEEYYRKLEDSYEKVIIRLQRHKDSIISVEDDFIMYSNFIKEKNEKKYNADYLKLKQENITLKHKHTGLQRIYDKYRGINLPSCVGRFPPVIKKITPQPTLNESIALPTKEDIDAICANFAIVEIPEPESEDDDDDELK